MVPLISYTEFEQTETIKYGSLATSASANKAPLFIKSELNRLYNEVMIKFGESPLAWDSTHLYLTGDSVSYNGVVYTALSSNTGQQPPSSAWKILDTSKYDLSSKYLLTGSDNYVNLSVKGNYKLMGAGNDTTSALMTSKTGLVPWDNGISSSLGNINLKFNDVYSVNGNFNSITTDTFTATSSTIENLTTTTINVKTLNVPSLNGTASNSLKLNGLVSSYFMPQWNYISVNANQTAANTDYLLVNTESIAQVDTISNIIAVDSTDYTVTINGTAYTFKSGTSATVQSIITGMVKAITDSNVNAADSGNSTILLTANTAGVSFTSSINANMTDTTTTANKAGPITVTLPASPSENDVIGFLDAKGTFAKNSLTVARNGKLIMGEAQDMIVSTKNMSFELLYTNGDWRVK